MNAHTKAITASPTPIAPQAYVAALQGRLQRAESVIASYVRATGFDDAAPCSICGGIEGCSHSFAERFRATGAAS